MPYRKIAKQLKYFKCRTNKEVQTEKHQNSDVGEFYHIRGNDEFGNQITKQ